MTIGRTNTQKFFPINTATACQLKWNWSTLYLHQATTASCHRTSFSKISPDDFDSFHNTPQKLEDRAVMLTGQWPTYNCAYCKNIEDSGGISDRMLHLTIPDLVPPELEINARAIDVTPAILEIYLNNTCNLGCLYCSAHLSSKINQEHTKFGNFSNNGVDLENISIDSNHPVLLDKLWNWLEHNSTRLKRIHILGGEPFYQREFDKFLEYFEKVPHPDLEFNIVTNLMIDSTKLLGYIDKFQTLLKKRHLRRIDITCSIDCVGPEQEFVRHGLDMDVWLKNFNLLLKQKWLTLNINQTISVLTIKTMPGLLVWLSEWRKERKVGHYFSVVAPGPSYLDPKILGPGVFEQDFENILKLMPENINHDYMSGIAKSLTTSVRNRQEILKLRTFLDEKDRRRHTNWKTTFPWLVQEIDNVV